MLLPLTANAQSIEINAENFPDVNFRNWLLEQDYGRDGVITEEEINGITEISVRERNISSLQGIEYFTALTGLSCSYNQLTSLDLSKNPMLTFLECFNNRLTSLDVSKNPALTYLDCSYNSLTSLDVSKNPALKELSCDHNQLSNLDVSNCPALDNLRCENNQLTSLEVSNHPALRELWCHNNQLSNLDVSNCPALDNSRCENNQLASLDVSNCPVLRILTCYNNQLTSLEVSNHPALTDIHCYNNQLTSLIVTNNPVLKILECYNNQLTNFVVANNAQVWLRLECYNNRLTSLDVSSNPGLAILYCSDNLLTSLDVSNNPNVRDIECHNNQIKGEAMDALIDGLPFTDRLSYIFVVDEGNPDEGNICTRRQAAAIKAKGWFCMNSEEKDYEGSDEELTIALPADHKYSTFSSDVALDFIGSSDVMAYTAKVVGEAVELTPIDKVPANTGVLIEKTGESTSATVYIIADIDPVKDNDLVAVGQDMTAGELVAANAYLLAEDAQFAKAEAASGSLSAGKAYLSVPDGTEARILPINLEGRNDVPDGLVHTASSFCGEDPAVFTSTVDAEYEHVNNTKMSEKWGGAAYAEFAFTLPEGQAYKAELTFTGRGESRNPRNCDVLYVNAGEQLDYVAMRGRTAKVDLAARPITSVTFPKGADATETFTVDVTEAVKAIAEAGQKRIIFKFTGNPGGGDLLGKASDNAPQLTIVPTGEDEKPTAISTVNADTSDSTIFNLQGQRVSNVKSGIYIVNGKKYVVKKP